MVHHGEQRHSTTHVTARLVLRLLEDSLQSSPSGCGTPLPLIHSKTIALRRALRDASSSSSDAGAARFPSLKHNLSATSSRDFMNTNSPTRASVMTTTPTRTSSSGGFSVVSSEEDDGLDGEERDRIGAAAPAADCSLVTNDEELPSPVTWWQPSSNQEWRDANPLDEFEHPALLGPVAALHGYAASDGDPVFLEKAYELARGVAGTKHVLHVSFDACRIALAIGYVHMLVKGAPEVANSFALKHSLTRLAQSCKSYWSSSIPDEETKRDESVSSLLEVISSVALMTGERDIWNALDEEPFGGVSEAIAVYLVRRPEDLKRYQGVGSACLRHHALSVQSDGNPALTDSE